MKTFFSALWTGWKELAGYFADFQSRWILAVFYFTILVPFGVIATFLMDALNVRNSPELSGWIDRTRQVDDIKASKRLF